MADSPVAVSLSAERLALHEKRMAIFEAKQQQRSGPKNWTIRNDITWLSMAKNLANQESFYIWVSRLYDYNKGILFRYMFLNRDKFSAQTLADYNQFLSLKGEPERFQVPIPTQTLTIEAP